MTKNKGRTRSCPNDGRPASCWCNVWLCFSCHVERQRAEAAAATPPKPR